MSRLWTAVVAFVFAATLTLVATPGCAAERKAVRVVQLGGQAMKAAEPILVAAYASALDACAALEPPEDVECGVKVRAQFEPVRSAIKLYHAAYCDLADFMGDEECKP